MKNNYYDIAINEKQYYEASSKASMFNNFNAIACQQISEKLLKHIAYETCSDISVLKTHKLRNIYMAVKQYITLPSDVINFLSTLSEFYFDARYPGDDYISVSDEDAKFAEETMLAVYDAVTEWVNKQSESKEDSSLLDKAIAAMNK